MRTTPEPRAPLPGQRPRRPALLALPLAALILWTGATGPAARAQTQAATPAMAPGAAAEPFQERLAQPALLAALRGGGYVLYMRHGTTDNSRADAVTGLSLEDCGTQRVLNDEGRRLAVSLGNTLRQVRIPIAEIIHSPLCRTTETARLAFPDFKGPMRADPDLMYTANLTSEQKKPVLVATRRLVSSPPPPGSNRLIVAHAPNLADLMGYFVKPEGTVVVLRPLGAGGFDYIASIPPTLWPQLIKGASPP